MRDRNRVFIPLVGGIGNQLFILNYGKLLSEKYNVEFILATEWLHDKNSYESTSRLVSAFKLKVSNELKLTYTERKIINAFFRSLALSKTKDPFSQTLAIVIKVVGRLLYKLFVSRKSQICSFEPEVNNLIPILEKDTTLIGYFQNNLIADKNSTNKALDTMWSGFPEKEKMALNHVLAKYSIQRSILIHHRLGDYEQDKLFTKLPQSYFIEAIQKQESKNNYCNRIILTNDVNGSKKMLNSISNLKYLDDEVKLSNLSWIIFGREFENYVLSNSTFGWWMAFLSKKTTFVFYPDPWFTKFHYDDQMNPNEWNRLTLGSRD